MTLRTWFGGTGSFTTAGDWSPAGVPQSGDTALITAGTVDVTRLDISAVSIGLGNFQSGAAAVLDLKAATVGDIGLDTSGPPDAEGYQTINISQYAIFTGLVAPAFESGGALTINVAAHGVMVSQGTLSVGGPPPGAITIDGGAGAVLDNQGLIEATGASIIIDPNVIGTGTVEMASDTPSTINSQVEFGGYVGPEQTVLFSGQAAAPSVELLLLDTPREFLAGIDGFAGSDTIDLANTTVTSDDFANGVLTLRDGHSVVADLHFAGSYTTDDFTITESGGGTLVSLNPSANDAVSAILHGLHGG